MIRVDVLLCGGLSDVGGVWERCGSGFLALWERQGSAWGGAEGLGLTGMLVGRVRA